MGVRKDVRSEAQVPGYLLFPKEEMSTYWETLAEKGKGSFLRQGSTAQGMAKNTKAAADSHGHRRGQLLAPGFPCTAVPCWTALFLRRFGVHAFGDSSPRS